MFTFNNAKGLKEMPVALFSALNRCEWSHLTGSRYSLNFAKKAAEIDRAAGRDWKPTWYARSARGRGSHRQPSRGLDYRPPRPAPQAIRNRSASAVVRG
jgi:hypothetical protein